MKINGIYYPVIGTVKISTGRSVPLVDIPMQSDEEWQGVAKQNAVDNYIKEFGKEPGSEAQAVKWQRDYVNALMADCQEHTTRLDPDGRIIQEVN